MCIIIIYYLLTVTACDVPPTRPGATVVGTGNPPLTTLGSEVTYQCNEGYLFENRSNIVATSTCLGRGIWSTPTTCRGIQACGVLFDHFIILLYWHITQLFSLCALMCSNHLPIN